MGGFFSQSRLVPSRTGLQYTVPIQERHFNKMSNSAAFNEKKSFKLHNPITYVMPKKRRVNKGKEPITGGKSTLKNKKRVGFTRKNKK
jgi:hypothetical protein